MPCGIWQQYTQTHTVIMYCIYIYLNKEDKKKKKEPAVDELLLLLMFDRLSLVFVKVI